MRGMNRIFIVGRLGVDPELKTARSGTPWCTLSVATNRAHKRGQEWIEETDWHDIRVFGDDAQKCAEKLKKGMIVAVDGSLVYEIWVDEAGQRRRAPRILAGRIQSVSDPKPRSGPEALPPGEARRDSELAEPTADLG